MGTAQTKFEFRTHGGKRKGAGRKPRGKRASERHRTRPEHDARHPVHVTCRVLPIVGKLRKRHVYKVVQWAVARASLKRDTFRICHVSIQNSHLHLLVEADGKEALARGMQGFQISCARLFNADISRRTRVKRRGQVFADRYHAVTLTSPRQVHHALAYVLNNWRRHREDVGAFRTQHDVYSTGLQSNVWIDAPAVISLKGIELLPVSFPTTWLLEHGWKKVGPISPWVTPGPR
jgi:REP element-mobilizing transposase RayT